MNNFHQRQQACANKTREHLSVPCLYEFDFYIAQLDADDVLKLEIVCLSFYVSIYAVQLCGRFLSRTVYSYL
jgi:hypothetical protein